MKIGTNDINKIMLGSAEVEKIYLGTEQVYPSEEPTHDYSKDYLTIESTSNNNTISLVASNTAITKTISASTDNGSTWTEYTSTTGGTQIASLNTGDKVLLKGDNSTYASSMSDSNKRFNYFISTGQFNAYGNMMSLISGDSFENADRLTGTYTFAGLFSGCTGLISAENLILPATTLMQNCYREMFRNCSNLTSPPVLPATTLTSICYSSMFNGCTSLTTAPDLPATTLAGSCYASMFAYCSSLTTAPELPATTLERYCYYRMFYGCTSLNYIKCLATDILANSCTSNWVSDVAATGTFVKAASMNDWTTGEDGIPDGWTVQDDAE